MTKNLERKKKRQIIGRTNRRRPIFNPTIQLVVVDLYAKYEYSILNGRGDIFDEKLEKKEKGTNKRKNKDEKSGEKAFLLFVLPYICSFFFEKKRTNIGTNK